MNNLKNKFILFRTGNRTEIWDNLPSLTPEQLQKVKKAWSKPIYFPVKNIKLPKYKLQDILC